MAAGSADDTGDGNGGMGGALGSSLALPRRASRAEMVAEAVEQQILDQGLRAGVRLGSRGEFGTKLGVAPSTVSEAIKLLESRGRVVTRTGPGGGVFVAEPGVRQRLARALVAVTGSEDEVAHALEVRDILELAVITSAADGGHSRRGGGPMVRALRAMGKAGDTAEFYRRNLAFHSEVAALCDNRVLGAIYASLLELVRSHDPQLKFLTDEDVGLRLASRFAVHEAIADAIVAGDVEAAREAANAHFLNDPSIVLTDTAST